MVKFCCVRDCKNEAYPGSPFSFHRFPTDEERKLAWINVVPGNVTKFSVICSAHFRTDDYMPGIKRNLKSDAIPSIFSARTSLQPIIYYDEHSTSPAPSPPPSPSTANTSLKPITYSEIIYTENHQEAATDDPRQSNLETVVEKQERVIRNQRMEIKRLQRKVARSRKTISTLKDLIKKKLSDE